jgi:predicted nucleic acid-binding protein
VKTVIFDTGPLVAWFCQRDKHHHWVRKKFTQIRPGGMVCEAVLAEVCHLVGKDGIASGRVIEFVERGGLMTIALGNELQILRKLLECYADAPMDFADACVVRIAELYPEASVCTVDSHFQFYRKNGAEMIPLIAPFEI